MRYKDNIHTLCIEKERMEKWIKTARLTHFGLSSAESSSSTTKEFINYKYYSTGFKGKTGYQGYSRSSI